MTPVDTSNTDLLAAGDSAQRDMWMTPEIVSFDVVVATQTNNGSNPGDGLANAS